MSLVDEHSNSDDQLTREETGAEKPAGLDRMLSAGHEDLSTELLQVPQQETTATKTQSSIEQQQQQFSASLSAQLNEIFASNIDPEESFRNMANPFRDLTSQGDEAEQPKETAVAETQPTVDLLAEFAEEAESNKRRRSSDAMETSLEQQESKKAKSDESQQPANDNDVKETDKMINFDGQEEMYSTPTSQAHEPLVDYSQSLTEMPAPQEQAETESLPVEARTAPAKSSIQITQKPVSCSQMSNYAVPDAAVKNSQSEPKAFYESANKQAPAAKSGRYYKRYVIQKVTKNVVIVEYTKLLEVCDKYDDSVISSKTVVANTRQRVMQETRNKKYVPISGSRHRSSREERPSVDVIELEEEEEEQEEDDSVYEDVGAQERCEEQEDERAWSSLEYAPCKLDDFLGPETSKEDMSTPMPAKKQQSIQIKDISPVEDKTSKSSKPISLKVLDEKPPKAKTTSKGKETSSEDDARITRSAKQSGRSTRSQGPPSEQLTLPGRTCRARTQANSGKQTKKHQNPVISFADLKIKLTAREAKRDQQDLQTRLQEFTTNRSTGEEVADKSSSSQSKEPNVYLSTSYLDESSGGAKTGLKFATSSTIPLYQATPYDPVDNYQCTIQQAIHNIETYESQFGCRAVLNAPVAVLQSETCATFTGYACESDQLVQLPNDYVENEITIPFQEPAEDLYEDIYSTGASKETEEAPASAPSSVQTADDAPVKRRRRNAPLDKFAKSFRARTPKKSAASVDQMRAKFKLRECFVPLVRMEESLFRQMYAKTQSPRQAKRFVRNVRALRTKSPRSLAANSQGSTPQTPTSVEELEQSNESPSAPAEFSVSEKVFAMYQDGNYHPAAVIDVRQVDSNGVAYSTYSCGFVENPDELINLDDPTARTDDLRQYELLKVDALKVKDNVYIKETTSRHSRLVKGQLINTPTPTADGRYDFFCQYIDQGEVKFGKFPLERIVIPAVQPTKSSLRMLITDKSTPLSSRFKMDDQEEPTPSPGQRSTLKWRRTSNTSSQASTDH